MHINLFKLYVTFWRVFFVFVHVCSFQRKDHSFIRFQREYELKIFQYSCPPSCLCSYFLSVFKRCFSTQTHVCVPPPLHTSTQNIHTHIHTHSSSSLALKVSLRGPKLKKLKYTALLSLRSKQIHAWVLFWSLVKHSYLTLLLSMLLIVLFLLV